MIVSFLEGKAKQVLTPDDCKLVGVEVAKMHEITKEFTVQRNNDLSINSWRKLFNSVKDPLEYLKRLEFHKNSKNYEDYFF